MIPFADSFDNVDSEYLPDNSQVIVTSYQFQCCGNITRWQTFVQPIISGYDAIIFQVWRPSPTVDSDGCYSLVGEDAFSQNLEGFTGGLVSADLGPSTAITVQPGDVIGYFTSSDSNDNSRSRINREIGIPLFEPDSDSESVWYHSNTPEEPLLIGPGACRFPVGLGSDRILRSSTNAAPAFSVDISE